jgi:hypothetical protein
MNTTSGIQKAVSYRAVLGAFMVALTLAGTALAGPLEDAMAAYERGDYATVLQLIYPLAAQGDAAATGRRRTGRIERCDSCCCRTIRSGLT